MSKRNKKEDLFIQNYYENEGIMLDKAKIEKNPGKRSVAKLKANSQWGFLAMKTNRVQNKFITNVSEWYDMLTDDQYVIHDINFTNHEVIHVKYTINDDMHQGGYNTNVAVAAFVTCQARLKLFEEIDRLQERVLYFDTDSIFYVSKLGEYEPSLGDYLGQFTNEIDSNEGNHIVEFVSAGPKNYAYKLDTGKTHCCVKGFSLNHVASLTINYESIKNMVQNNQNSKLDVEQQTFVRNKKNFKISTEIVNKKYGFVYDKRVLKKDFTTLPYGF